MRRVHSRRHAIMLALVGVSFATPVLAQDKTAKIGVLNDMTSLYADIGGPNSVQAAKMAVADSGLEAKGWKIDVVFGDHQNKPDIGSSVARRWYDVEQVDVRACRPGKDDTVEIDANAGFKARRDIVLADAANEPGEDL